MPVSVSSSFSAAVKLMGTISIQWPSVKKLVFVSSICFVFLSRLHSLNYIWQQEHNLPIGVTTWFTVWFRFVFHSRAMQSFLTFESNATVSACACASGLEASQSLATFLLNNNIGSHFLRSVLSVGDERGNGGFIEGG